MKKTAFKTFVYSFVFSLFVIFTLNRAFFDASQEEKSPLKISNKNVVLFIKNNDISPIKTVAVPTKKIILSDMSISKPEVSSAPDINIPIIESTKDIVSADTPALPLEIAPLNEKVVALNSAVQKEDKDISQLSTVADNKASISTDISADIPLVIEKIDKKPIYTPEKTNQIASSHQQRDIASLTPAKLQKQDEPLPRTDNNPKSKEDINFEKKAHQVAQLNPEQAVADRFSSDLKKDDKVQEQNPPLMLIPLESSSEKLFADAKVKTSLDATSNQVALNSQNVPISSMTNKNISTQTQKSAETRTWQSMKDKRPDDDPWLVAKGKSFPKNQMLQDDKKFNLSDKEVDKLFLKKDATPSNDEVLLASKTVDNLLIPIPEDILNDENLTPQLISSPKNQEIKEELEAKGLIRKEEENKQNNLQDSNSDEFVREDKNSNGKSSNILDSITSLFSTNSDTTPEIGVNENEEESTNSLFSAFSRKQNKLMSKILPTEIRLSFQPNRAEISGQTLRWIKAFAQKTAEEPTTGLEIRIDGTSSPLLQRRRLNLLQNILINEGALPEKINTVFTVREPNSFILRTVRINKEISNIQTNDKNRYLQW